MEQFNGVRKINNKYVAQLYFEGKFTVIGEYKTEEEAEDKYDDELSKVWTWFKKS
tara:strand:+ start:436 stop:600 length:165 start_codon:yes stop_codon:yes gene_type:complete